MHMFLFITVASHINLTQMFLMHFVAIAPAIRYCGASSNGSANGFVQA